MNTNRLFTFLFRKSGQNLAAAALAYNAYKRGVSLNECAKLAAAPDALKLKAAENVLAIATARARWSSLLGQQLADV